MEVVCTGVPILLSIYRFVHTSVIVRFFLSRNGQDRKVLTASRPHAPSFLVLIFYPISRDLFLMEQWS